MIRRRRKEPSTSRHEPAVVGWNDSTRLNNLNRTFYSHQWLYLSTHGLVTTKNNREAENINKTGNDWQMVHTGICSCCSIFTFVVFRLRRTRRRRGRNIWGKYRARPVVLVDQVGQLGHFRRWLRVGRVGREVRWGLLDRAVHLVQVRRCRQEGLVVRPLRRVPCRRGCWGCSERVGRHHRDRRLGLVVREVRSGRVVQLGRAVRCFLAGLVVQVGRCCRLVRMGLVGRVGRVGKGCMVGSQPPRRQLEDGLAFLERLGRLEYRACRWGQGCRRVRDVRVCSILRIRLQLDAW